MKLTITTTSFRPKGDEDKRINKTEIESDPKADQTFDRILDIINDTDGQPSDLKQMMRDLEGFTKEGLGNDTPTEKPADDLSVPEVLRTVNRVVHHVASLLRKATPSTEPPKPEGGSVEGEIEDPTKPQTKAPPPPAQSV